MGNQYRFTKPPKTLRRPAIQLDNFSLVSANLLGNMSAYRALTDRQPKGTAVLVLPSPTSSLRSAYAAIARALKAQGKTVKLYSAGA
jgi:flavorubredoxin